MYPILKGQLLPRKHITNVVCVLTVFCLLIYLPIAFSVSRLPLLNRKYCKKLQHKCLTCLETAESSIFSCIKSSVSMFYGNKARKNVWFFLFCVHIYILYDFTNKAHVEFLFIYFLTTAAKLISVSWSHFFVLLHVNINFGCCI